MKNRYYIATMGCQMNEYDSDFLEQLLMNSGFVSTENYEHADLIIINTCTVRAKAQQKAFSLLGRMVSLKKRKNDLILCIMGCIAQQEGQDLVKRFPELDLVLGTRQIAKAQQLLARVIEKREKVVETDLSAIKFPCPVGYEGYFNGKVKAYVSIMEGCNNYCSYCIVPYVRGRETSRPSQEIIKEVKYLISQGIREVTLLGQNVNSYESKEGKGVNFPILLKMISDLNGLTRIRFTTSHPKDLSDDLIACFRDLFNLCPHIHLPFQAGSNKILKMMNRKYTREQYVELVSKLRDTRPNFAITSDVMVGFPGESDDDFNKTLDLISKIEFDNLFSFKYSDRKGTLAEKMGGKINEDKKAARLTILQSIQKDITLKKNESLVGREEDVLVEGKSKKGGQLTGRTQTNKIVNFDCDISMIGEIAKVSIQRASINSLQGVMTKS